MAADRKLLAATFAAIAFLTAGPARAALSPPRATAPAAGATLVFLPSFAWTPVKNADHDEFQISADPGMGSPVLGQGKDDFFTNNTRATLTQTVPNGTYYWHVRAISADGSVSPWTTTRALTKLWNLMPALQNPGPGASLTFPWNPVPGAARYEVEINPSVDFAPGSKVCCSGTTIATSLSPPKVFKNDTYHWRVRAIDPGGNAGVWNVGPDFKKTFDNVPPVTNPAIKNLHMRDNTSDPGVDQDLVTPGYQTEVPIVTWNPVPGASAYHVE